MRCGELPFSLRFGEEQGGEPGGCKALELLTPCFGERADRSRPRFFALPHDDAVGTDFFVSYQMGALPPPPSFRRAIQGEVDGELAVVELGVDVDRPEAEDDRAATLGSLEQFNPQIFRVGWDQRDEGSPQGVLILPGREFLYLEH